MDLLLMTIEAFSWSLLVFGAMAAIIALVMGAIDRMNGV
jgi:hypothetical protein